VNKEGEVMPKKKERVKVPETFIAEFIRPKEFRDIVRIAETDIPGDMPLLYALKRVLGVGISLANAVIKKLGLKPNQFLGLLDEEQITKIDEIIRSPTKYGIPSWLVNRRRDKLIGEDRHIIGSALTLQIKKDIEQMINLGSWKGIRHSKGLKARGQRLGRTRPRSIIHHLKR